jgi:signal peptidase I
MESTVHVGERVVFNKKLSPAREDIVIVHLARDGHAYDAILRVVALPGDTIGCPAGPTGRCEAVVVNGTPVPEPYLGPTVADPFPTNMVPDHMVFLAAAPLPTGEVTAAVGSLALEGRPDLLSGRVLDIGGPHATRSASPAGGWRRAARPGPPGQGQT